MTHTLGLSFVALILAYLGVAGLRQWAERWQVLDIPNERSSHMRPTPRGGGLAIVVLTLAGLISWGLFNAVGSWIAFLAYVTGATWIAGISWLDDRHSLPNRLRIAVHGLGAILAIWGFGFWDPTGIAGQHQFSWLGLPITFVWIVGLTNAYNFMDGIDGVAGGQAVLAGLGWAFVGWWSDQALVSVLGLLIAGSSLGFLGHNWPPARIFMGDVGSAFLGYNFAVLPLIASQNQPRLFLAGPILLWPFLFDTFFTFLRRAWRGENVFAAHRSHLYQRLNIVGFTHRAVTLLYLGLGLIGVGLAVAWSTVITASLIAIGLLLLLTSLVLWAFVVRQEHRRSAKVGPNVSTMARKV